MKAPHDGWLIAGMPRWKPYPCRCELGRACGYKCQCVGRTDVTVIPAHCCARRKAENAARLDHRRRSGAGSEGRNTA